MRVDEHRDRFPRAFVVSPSLQILKSQLDRALSNLLVPSLLEAGEVALGGLQRFLPASVMLYVNDMKCPDMSKVHCPSRGTLTSVQSMRKGLCRVCMFAQILAQMGIDGRVLVLLQY